MKQNPPLKEEQRDDKWLKRSSLLWFTAFLILLGSFYGIWKWVNMQPSEMGALKPLRRMLSANEKFFEGIFNTSHLIKEYSASQAVKHVRVNGSEGLDGDIDGDAWRLRVVRSEGDTFYVSLADIRQLPRKEVIFDFKCIEGWSQVTRWAGVPVKTFCEHYHLDAQTQLHYIGLETPDRKYYVGIDMKSVLHPQTILCYEMNGAPLPLNQGFPVRLIIPVKYGIKHLKRLGTLFFSNEKPRDYWAERGYDYYAGH